MKYKNIIMWASLILVLSIAVFSGTISSSLDTKQQDYLTDKNVTESQELSSSINTGRLKEAKQEIFKIASNGCDNVDNCEALLEWMEDYNKKECSITCK